MKNKAFYSSLEIFNLFEQTIFKVNDEVFIKFLRFMEACFIFCTLI
jgi:hypothetical protein